MAGIVNEIGEGVTDVAVGDRVFGFSGGSVGAGAAELAVLSDYAPIPPSLDFAAAAALPVALETATRALDALGAGAGKTLLINGASGGIGSARRPARRGARRARDRHRQSRPTTITCARWAPSPSPTARAWPGGFARSRLTASTWRSTSLEAACCPSSSRSPAARTMS